MGFLESFIQSVASLTRVRHTVELVTRFAEFMEREDILLRDV